MVKNLDCSGRYTLPRNLTNVSFPKYATDPELVAFYNQYSGSTQIKKFATREMAEKKCLELKQAMDWLAMSAQSTKKENKVMAAKKTKQANAKAAKGSKKAAAKTERKNALLDHTVHKLQVENPRREGTHGYKTWGVIKNGMTYRDAIDAGARNKDIRHDISQGRMKLVAPGGAKPPAPKPAPKAKKEKAPEKPAPKAKKEKASPKGKKGGNGKKDAATSSEAGAE